VRIQVQEAEKVKADARADTVLAGGAEGIQCAERRDEEEVLEAAALPRNAALQGVCYPCAKRVFCQRYMLARK